jgi:hypothetical protein
MSECLTEGLVATCNFHDLNFYDKYSKAFDLTSDKKTSVRNDGRFLEENQNSWLKKQECFQDVWILYLTDGIFRNLEVTINSLERSNQFEANS